MGMGLDWYETGSSTELGISGFGVDFGRLDWILLSTEYLIDTRMLRYILYPEYIVSMFAGVGD